MATLTQPIGVVLPITHGVNGYFRQSYSALEQIKSNILMLLKTKKGERRMNPEFGTGLWNVLFEFKNEELTQIVESTVRYDVGKWLPYVKIKSVNVAQTIDGGEAPNGMQISVVFTADSLGITSPQTLQLSAQQGTQ